MNETTELVHVYVNGEEIQATPSHPFYVAKFGWTKAINLRAGDILVLSNGEYVVVEAIQHEILESPIKVYNFEVEDFHTYFVGESFLLVHNMCVVDEKNNDDPSYYFRGTTEGYPGNPSLQQLGVTPTSTDPYVAAVFATNGELYGEGVLHIANLEDLKGLSKFSPNVLEEMELEVVWGISPTEFAKTASTSISSSQARAILGEMGYNIPSYIPNDQISSLLTGRPKLSADEIAIFVKKAGGK